MADTERVKSQIEAADIPSMLAMSAEQYQAYIENELLFVDHHGILRSGPGEFPLAVTSEQFKALRAHLNSLVGTVGR